VVVAVVGVAVLVVGGLIYLSSGMQGSNVTPPKLDGIETGLTAEGLPYKGAANAPVTIDIYSDYKCSHCKDFALETEPQIDKMYVATGKVKFVSHYFGFSSETQAIATGAMCAAEQGKFWDLDYVLFVNQLSTNANNVSVFARQVGVNIDVFNKCAQSAANRAKIQGYTSQANAAGVQATPTFFINGKKIEGTLPLAEFQQEIEQALAEVK
jgi:protein-disulfide isomerase